MASNTSATCTFSTSVCPSLLLSLSLFLFACHLHAVHLVYEEKPIFGKPPSARGYHICILADSHLFFFVGHNGSLVFDDVYIVDLAASSYLSQVTSFKIEI
jgi:hypothetical protein